MDEVLRFTQQVSAQRQLLKMDQRQTLENVAEVEGTVLRASHVYLLMSKEYRISRNRRAEWFFTYLNTTVSVTPKYKLEEFTEELEIVSIIPKDAPHTWSIEASHLFRFEMDKQALALSTLLANYYLVCSDTIVEILSRKYRFVYCLDISPSAGSVDVQTGMVTVDGIYGALQNSMEGLVKPFYVPGSYFIFQPKIYVSVIAHAPFLSSYVDEAIVQGALLDSSTCKHILKVIFRKLEEVENRVAKLTSIVSEANAKESKEPKIIPLLPPSKESGKNEGIVPPTPSLAMSPDFGLVDLLRHALIALHLLPECSTSGLIVLTDGVISVPDGGYLDMILSQFRYNTISCSFIQLSSPFHPHASYGALPYSNLMRFISTATFGAFLTNLPKIEPESQAMNAYHKCFLTWSFQDSVESFKSSLMAPFANKPGEWSVQNKCFSTIRDMPVIKKQQYETTMNVDYLKVLSCRLREGFSIKEAQVGKDNMLRIKLILPWKFLIVIEYMLITPWPAVIVQPKVTSVVSLEAPYDFLHDVTCLAKKPFQSYYRQLLVNKFWASQKHLSESDKLLAHFNSFVSNPQYYNIPERLKNGVPLFCISANSATLTFQSSESFPHFSQFWKPVCLLDTDIWQKWMHTHSIAVVLEHDHPIPMYIHQPNSSGRYHVIQCRQTMMGLNKLLMDWSSFVLVESHSYIKLFYKEKEKPPNYFCIIRVTTKPPCVILRLAYLVGTPGRLRHDDISELCRKIACLTFPQRLNEPPKWRVPSGSSFLAKSSRNFKRAWSDMPCCVILLKPIEKILIRYEQIPENFAKSLIPQDPHNNLSLTPNRKMTSNQSTFGFRPTYSTPLGSQIKMGPEMFNTVARYLHHRRWIWSIQGTPTHPLSTDCVVRILSTITKMRLQEGMRFAYTSGGIVNMVMEMQIQNERLGLTEPEVENIEDYERTTSILQYLMFPPVTSLFSSVDEDEEEGEDEVPEPSEETSTLYLITECWVEPQLGKILSSSESTSFHDLQYDQVPNKIFDMDQQCMSALVTFEHLSLMCQDDNVPSPSEVVDRGMGKPLEETEDKIQYIPFRCELKRILPKCQQAELLFSMFNQDLAMSFPVVLNSDISIFCDRANSILYETWISNVAQMHKREVMLNSEEHKTLYELITRRVQPLGQGEQPFARRIPGGSSSYPKWRSFIKGISPTHFLLTILPASYHDLKLLMLSPETLDRTNENKAVCLLSSEDPNDSSYINERSFTTSQMTPHPGNTENSLQQEEAEIDDKVEPQLPQESRTSPPPLTIGLRKRSRVKSGGESGPASKKPLNRKTSLDNLFRCRTNSFEKVWKPKTVRGSLNLQNMKDLDDSSCILTPKTESEPQASSQFSFETVGNATTTPQDKLFPPNHQTIYGSITLPIYVYDCSLAALTEHVIFRTICSGSEDIYTDCRVCSISEENESYPTKRPCSPSKSDSPVKQVSPEPKSEDQELPPTNTDTLENHCQALEVAFAKSYVHGLFESLQAGHYIHSKDVQEAVRLCHETKIELNLSEFIQTICRHFKEIKRRNRSGECPSEEPCPSCDELKDIHAFIKRRFNQSILAAFHWVMDCAGIFYYKNLIPGKLNEVQSRSNSSKNLTDVDDISGIKVAGESIEPEILKMENTTGSGEKSEIDLEYPILGPDFFTLDEVVEPVSEEQGPVPLFLYLACTYVHSDFSGSFLVYDIPTCLEEIAEAFGDGFEEGNPDDKIEMVLEFVFLTVPTAVEEIDYRVAGTIRTSSMCNSLSHGAPMGKKGELNFIPFSKERENSLSGMFDHGGRVYPILPSQQYHQVKSAVDEVKWLLKDEVTSFRWELSPMTQLALTLVACHVEKSPGKPGCQVTIVPLNFVNNSAQLGFEKFRERFRKSFIEGYELKEEGSLFYLVPIPKNFQNTRCKISALERTLKTVTDQGISDEMMKLSLEIPQASSSQIEFELEDPELLEISAQRDQQQIQEKRLRKCSGQDSVIRSRIMSSGGNSGIDAVDGASGEQQGKREGVSERSNFLPTPSQLSEISSIMESMNTNEDGYEGDGSDSAEDFVDKLETSIRNRNLPPFWIICKISVQQVVIYFHSRYDEENTALFEHLITLRNKVVRMVRQLKRTVNQDILLQQLHDTRQCSNLIEAKIPSPDYVEHALHYPPPIINKRIEDFEHEGENEPKQFPSGYFACDVVWETKFVLHSRLRTGPGKTVVSRGIQTLRGALMAFEVQNRQNMFVYQDQSGNVFYLRLYRMEDKVPDLCTREIEEMQGESRKETSKDSDVMVALLGTREPLNRTSATPPPERNETVILLRVHGITEAGFEIKDGLAQSLRNKLDDAIMDSLSVIFDRNPHCKLTQEDVNFIQKPNSSPDTFLQSGINSYALQHLPAFAFFLHQNLLQYFYLPKYADQKQGPHCAEFHFRDYPEPNEGEPGGTMYLYNQHPGGTGSRGIAAVAVSIVDLNGKSISAAAWSRPAPDAFLTEFKAEDFEERIMTIEMAQVSQSTPAVFVEMRIWKQGRIHLDLLKGYLTSAIKHSIWDLTTEFYFLTAPLSTGVGPPSGENPHFTFSFSAPNTPTRIGSGNDGRMYYNRASSPMAFPFPGQTVGKGRVEQLDPLVVGLSSLETGDVGHLHSLYDKLFPAWCEFGAKQKVPSVRLATIDLGAKHPVDTVVLQTEKLVQQILPEYEPKPFWKLETYGESSGEYLAGARVLADARLLLRKNTEAELKVLKCNLRQLESVSGKSVLDNYPQDLIPLFKSTEEFHPQGGADECILISRNLIHWKFCVGSIDSQFFTLEAFKTQYKFPPLISSAWDQTPLGSYVSLEKLPRPTSATGLACLLNEPENNMNPVLIPRQRFMLAKITNTKISFIFYNWSKETTERLIDNTKLLASWLNARSCLLSSIHAQKSGLFYNQPITRGPLIGNNETNPFTGGGAEVESLLQYSNPPKDWSLSRTSNLKKPKSVKNLTPFLECFRNLKHQATVSIADSVILDPFKAIEDQMTQIRCSEKAESKHSIFQYWLSRGPSASNVIGADGIQAFKQAARTLHYCFTPIIFLPRWRSEIACTRDNSIGIVKKSRALSDPSPKPMGFHLKADLAGLRSRHDSGTSQKSLDSTTAPTSKTRSKSIWGLWQNSSSQISQDSQASSGGNPSLTNLSSGTGTGKKADEKWHGALCDSFIQEYMQYLQTLGFIPIQGKNTTTKKLTTAQGVSVKTEVSDADRLRHISGASMLSSSSSQSGHSMGVTFNNFSRRVREDSGNGEKVFYLQKSLLGGIILFEVGLAEPFFYAKLHALEATRIQARKSRKGIAHQNILDFMSQCEKMKVLMHLHSFTYDFHLRSIHSYILGRQLMFKQGYHITNFLDDFVKYYPKGPNYARNTVHIGMMTIQNVTTPAPILFGYMLEKLYNMKVIRMTVERSYENNHCVQQFILVDLSSKKVVYRDHDDERQCDEFDLTLLIAHDSPPFVSPYSVDTSVLRLKYYIILTSRRELYPKTNDQVGVGKLYLVNTPEVLCRRKESRPSTGTDPRTGQTRKESLDERGQADPGDGRAYSGIREEPVHYMSFFSSHEQMMQQVVTKQVDWVEERIRNLVSTASVDCRRDLLWQRLALPNSERQKNQKEDLISRETVGALTYWEFGELLELVHAKSLSRMDPRLAYLLNQSPSFYHTLLKLIKQGGFHNFRHFASHDKLSHHLAIFSSNSDNISSKATKHIVLLDINLEKPTADLSILFKDVQEGDADVNKSPELEPDMLNLIEDVVNTVCYCWWWWSTVCPS